VNILFITQENHKRPSGVSTVINTLCREWSYNDSITILINKRHQGFLSLDNEAATVEIVRMPVLLPSELLSLLKIDSGYGVVNIVSKITTRLLLLIYPIFFIYFMSVWMKKKI